MAPWLELLHDPLRHQVDLLGVVRDGPEHEILQARAAQVLDALVEAVGAADHVALLQMLVATMRAHGPNERRLRLLRGLLVARRVHHVDEVAVAEGDLLRILPLRAGVLLQESPVALDPLLRPRAAGEPVPRLDDAVHDGGGDDGHVVLAGVGHARAARHPDLRHPGRPRLDRHVAELVVLAREGGIGLGQELRHRLDDLVGALPALLDARPRDLVLPRVPAGPDPEHVAVLREMAERRDLLGEDDRMPHGQHQDARGDLDRAGEGGRVGEHVERLEPGIAVEAGRGEKVVDDPDVDAVLLALLDGLADALDVLGIALASAPGIGGDPSAEPELCHRERPPQAAEKGPSASLAPSAAGSTYREYASPANQLSPHLASAVGRRSPRSAGRRLASGPFLSSLQGSASVLETRRPR